MKTCWAIQIKFSPNETRKTYLAGTALFETGKYEPQGTKLFFRRKDAEQAIRVKKAESSWAFKGKWAGQGGNRIYLSWEPVRVSVTIEEVTK